MTCPHNFHAWPQPTLANLATDQYNQILVLKALVEEYRKAISRSDAGDADMSMKQIVGHDARRGVE